MNSSGGMHIPSTSHVFPKQEYSHNADMNEFNEIMGEVL